MDGGNDNIVEQESQGQLNQDEPQGQDSPLPSQPSVDPLSPEEVSKDRLNEQF